MINRGILIRESVAAMTIDDSMVYLDTLYKNGQGILDLYEKPMTFSQRSDMIMRTILLVSLSAR